MPRKSNVSSKKFEKKRKNFISLRDDEHIDENQKVVKVGDKNSILSLSTDELKIEGDLFLSGKLSSHKIETDNAYLDFVTGAEANQSNYFQFYGGVVSEDEAAQLIITQTGGFFNFTSQNTFGFDLNGDGAYQAFTFGSDLGAIITFGLYNTGTDKTLFRVSSPEGSSDYCDILVADDGVTEILTVDADAALAHLTLKPDGDLILDPDSTKIIINATDDLYFDGGTHTFISEHGDDILRITVGGDTIIQFSEKGDDGNEVHFGSSCAGFTQLEPTYDATDTEVDFRHSNKQFLTFGSGNITNLKLTFPIVSGNFVLLIKQDGTGSRTITNYKAMEFDESAADGSAAVKFAGGSNPTLTTDANHVDILSFYWDADNEIAYGVATLDFQF